MHHCLETAKYNTEGANDTISALIENISTYKSLLEKDKEVLQAGKSSLLVKVKQQEQANLELKKQRTFEEQQKSSYLKEYEELLEQHQSILSEEKDSRVAEEQKNNRSLSTLLQELSSLEETNEQMTVEQEQNEAVIRAVREQHKQDILKLLKYKETIEKQNKQIQQMTATQTALLQQIKQAEQHPNEEGNTLQSDVEAPVSISLGVSQSSVTTTEHHVTFPNFNVTTRVYCKSDDGDPKSPSVRW